MRAEVYNTTHSDHLTLGLTPIAPKVFNAFPGLSLSIKRTLKNQRKEPK